MLTLKEYLAQAPERDRQELGRQSALEKAQDVHFDAWSDFIDDNPIGRISPRGGCHGD